MPRTDYIQANDDAFSGQLQTFKSAIADYATTLAVTPAQVTSQAADADYFASVLANQSIIRNSARQWADWKKLIRDGGATPATGAPAAPSVSLPATSVAPGIEPRFRSLVQQCKGSPGYNSSIGAALGIEGAEQTGPDLTTVQPDIGATISGGQVMVKWGWGGYSGYLDMCEIQVDRGDGKGFVALCFDTTPNYTDTTPFPATPAKWTYQAIYRVGDQRVGQWSKPVSVTVGG